MCGRPKALIVRAAALKHSIKVCGLACENQAMILNEKFDECHTQ